MEPSKAVKLVSKQSETILVMSKACHNSLTLSSQKEEEESPHCSRAVNPRRTNKGGLPAHVEKQLLQFIESTEEGIRGFSLGKLSEEEKEELGGSESSRSRQLVNRLTYLKGLSEESYLLALANFGVLPYHAQQPAPPSSVNSSPVEPLHSSYSTSLPSSEERSQSTTALRRQGTELAPAKTRSLPNTPAPSLSLRLATMSLSPEVGNRESRAGGPFAH